MRGSSDLFLFPLIAAWTTRDNTKMAETDCKTISFVLVVKNSITGAQPLNYDASVVERGILLGGLKRLMDTNPNFKFTYTENPDFGPYLESVNGVAGNLAEHTYWELLSQKEGGKVIPLDVGIGCYIPSKNEKIILNFTKWSESADGKKPIAHRMS
ncbi:transcobalamin-1-like isoform X1 [Mugil cephalus]|uniref:transcobalamin-1-like isoform X1 n=1 Tax=Mugil cephalus TaxID=48193 RepID=UPI001FB768BF|nr:transcobalamin-1-like isoform X1 [Mugil cephalus]